MRLPVPAVLLVGCLLTTATPTALALERAPGGPAVTVVAGGLEIPWDIAFLPDGRALVTERPGTVRLVGPDGTPAATPAAQVAVSQRGDGGLLGVAVDPAFGAATPFVYLTHTSDDALRITRWRLQGTALVRDGQVLSVMPTGGVHNSARLRFGPDAALYVGTGDGGDPSDARSPGNRAGKVLRIAPGAYRGDDVAPSLVALGLRHPQGMAWQPGSGRFFVTDHGPSDFDGPSGDDELDEIVQDGDYGWPTVRGADHGAFRAPVHLWPETIAPASIAFVTLPGSTWTGNALVTGLKGQVLRRLTFDGGRVIADEPLLAGTYGRLRAVAEAPDGSVWVTTSNRDPLGTPRAGDDRIIRIVPPAAPVAAPGLGSGAPVPATTPGPRAAATRVTLRRIRSPRTVRAGRAVSVRLTFSVRPRGPVVLQRRAGRAWRNVTAVRRAGRGVRLVTPARTAGLLRLRVRYGVAPRLLYRGLTVRVLPVPVPPAQNGTITTSRR